ncbi:MAG: gamma-glutamyltransferase family protein, partial [Planctomycetota bacterium]
MRASVFLLLASLLACSSAPYAPPLQRGVVAAAEPAAAKIGADVLRGGGSAVDAAVAVQFALAVTHPGAGNIGGGGFLLVCEPRGRVHALDYRETAPAAAHPKLFQDADGNVVEHLSLNSHLAAGVPGTVRGMWEAHRKFGKLPWKDLLAPAIRLAEQGFAIDAALARSIAESAARFSALPEKFRGHVNFTKYFHGKTGDRLVQEELAATLRRIAEKGPDGFYRGETARLIVEEMKRGGGLITPEDLESYRAKWRMPVEGTYRGHRVVSMPPPSSGGVALVQMLNMLEGFQPPPMHSPMHLHLVAEIEKRVFADRSVHLGDS